MEMLLKSLILQFILMGIERVNSNEAPFSVCPNAPLFLDKVEAVVYITGETSDDDLIKKICKWNYGFTDDSLSVTFKVGVNVEDQGGTLVCNSNPNGCIFLLTQVCYSKLLNNYMEFLCNFVNKTNPKLPPADDLEKCVSGEHPSVKPAEIALQNSAEAAKFNRERNELEPFVTINGQYDTCTSEMAKVHWAESICSMLTDMKYNKLQSCLDSFVA